MTKLACVFDGWNGYQTSLLHAVTPLITEQLMWRPAADRRSVGELIRHLSLGRITWFARIGAPGMEGILERIPQWQPDEDGERHVLESAVPCDQSAVLVEWLELSWKPIECALEEWTVEDLFRTYPHHYAGKVYSISRQWTLWRIMAHDIHHGGQLALMLALQGIEAFELRALGGHIISPPLANN
jgi:uncharacterized damage-inducible protein DinB